MAKSPEWHESLTLILERRQRLISEVRRGRTLSPEARKLALSAIEAEAFAAAQRVFPRPPSLIASQGPGTSSATVIGVAGQQARIGS